jgi:hypothetical protein
MSMRITSRCLAAAGGGPAGASAALAVTSGTVTGGPGSERASFTVKFRRNAGRTGVLVAG